MPDGRTAVRLAREHGRRVRPLRPQRGTRRTPRAFGGRVPCPRPPM